MIELKFDVLQERMVFGLKMLPGEVAHARLSPPNRKPASTYLEYAKDYKVAAVMALIYPDAQNDPCILLMERTGGAGVHAGQISFPGGKQEEGESLEQTALRETQEELGFDPSLIQVAGPLSPLYIPPSNFLVQPFLGFMNEMPSLKPNEAEVKGVIKAPLHQFFDESNMEVGEFFSSGGYKVRSPYFKVEHHRIWGATAMMLSEIVWLAGK
jgi:8-oxo-dGTP pyrophosphatase MutT (NUDIX family)